ncbi:hypothetical protein [Streptomyces hydrogenans]|uniref:hypothetical protein n=1 Tax=Streptomyces hydrogenans TaxID=1873719 RepID=UPI0038005EDD
MPEDNGDFVARIVIPEGKEHLYRFPCHVYVVVHDRLEAVKVGLSTTAGDNDLRVAEHVREGWRLHRRMKQPDLGHAEAVEEYALLEVRRRGIEHFLTPKQMPQGGNTETFARVRVSEYAMEDIVRVGMRRVRVEYTTRPRKA